ncbi:MAG: sigma-70 family RNA polymerase sigma factor [Planctomycetaceae bacterium]
MPHTAQFRELIQRVRNRDEDAARELTLRYEKAIRRVVRIHLRDARLRAVMDSMDVCQSVLASFFVRTVLGQYELETPEQLINLLTTIARNKLTNQVHKHQALRRDIRRNRELGSDGQEFVDPQPGPEQSISAKETLELVLSRLDSNERYLAEQKAQGKTWQELADDVGGTDVALRKKLTRAVDRVLTELGLDNIEDA